MPIAVSASRETSTLSLFANPVLSTITAVAATVVPWPDSQGSAPRASPAVIATATDTGSSARLLPTAQATSTPSTAAPTCRAPSREGAVDRGVHDQQRRPGRQERLRQVEHPRGQDPGDHRGHDRLDGLEHVGPEDRVADAVVGQAPGVRRPHHRIGAPETDRAMTSRWISEVPSKIV